MCRPRRTRPRCCGSGRKKKCAGRTFTYCTLAERCCSAFCAATPRSRCQPPHTPPTPSVRPVRLPCVHAHARNTTLLGHRAGESEELHRGRQPAAAAAQHKAHAPKRPTAGPTSLSELAHGRLGAGFGSRGPKRTARGLHHIHCMPLAQHCTPQLVVHGLPSRCVAPSQPRRHLRCCCVCGAHHTHWRLAARALSLRLATGSSNHPLSK